MASLMRSAIVATVLAGAVAAAALYLRQHEGASARDGFPDAAKMRAAYDRVAVGMPVSRLALIGFDRTAAGVHTLSYLGAMEFFMPGNSRGFDRLAPAILSCLAATDRCGAYVFRGGGGQQRSGIFGFAAHAAAPGDVRIVFLVKSGRVTYKAMVGG